MNSLVSNTVLASTALALGMRMQYLLEESDGNGKVPVDRATIIYVNVMLMAAALWLVLFSAVIGYEQIIDRPEMLAPLAWVPAVIAGDVLISSASRSREAQDPNVPTSQPRPKSGDMRASIGTLISGSFSIGVLVFNSKKSHDTSRLIKFGLLLMLGVALPTFHIPTDHLTSTYVHAVQMAAFHYAIGLLVCGIFMSFRSPPPLLEGGAEEGATWRVGRGGLTTVCPGAEG